jgi:tetratricopeptide (TPR) repeat protein
MIANSGYPHPREGQPFTNFIDRTGSAHRVRTPPRRRADMGESLEQPHASEPNVLYQAACSCLDRGEFELADRLWQQVVALAPAKELAAKTCNDMAVLRCARGDSEGARELFRRALELDESCETARSNLALLDQDPVK